MAAAHEDKEHGTRLFRSSCSAEVYAVRGARGGMHAVPGPRRPDGRPFAARDRQGAHGSQRTRPGAPQGPLTRAPGGAGPRPRRRAAPRRLPRRAHRRRRPLPPAAQVEGDERTLLVPAADGYPFVIESMAAADAPAPTSSADLEATTACSAGPLVWALQPCAPTKRSQNAAGDPVYLFSLVDEARPERVYVVVLPKGAPGGGDAFLGVSGPLTGR
jgi:hypothetical protein